MLWPATGWSGPGPLRSALSRCRLAGALQHPVALAEQPDIDLTWLLELATMAIADADAIVRVSGAEILSRIVRDGVNDPIGAKARGLLQSLQQDSDHRVVAAVLNGLQAS